MKIHHVSFNVADTKRSLAFYHGVLGLNVDPDRPELGYPGAWLQIETQQIHLLELPNPDPVQGRPEHGGRDRHTALAVSDIGELQRRLEQYNIAFSKSRSGRAAVFFRDLDGNAIECVEITD